MVYKVIVVGTDGSERSMVAVNEALGLAKASGAKLHVVNAVHPAVEVGYVESKAGQLQIDKVRRGLEAISAAILAEAKQHDVPVETHNPGSTDAADALISLAEEVDADLVVVGNRGMSGVKRFALGSVPNKVAHHCPCSVLIVNTEAS
jgi:nucleotide-binding universal stress UspA family protein